MQRGVLFLRTMNLAHHACWNASHEIGSEAAFAQQAFACIRLDQLGIWEVCIMAVPKVGKCCRSGGPFRPPMHHDWPVLMIGPGTGVAPFLGFLQQRHAVLQAAGTEGAGPAWLFFGCRSLQEDFLFHAELEVTVLPTPPPPPPPRPPHLWQTRTPKFTPCAVGTGIIALVIRHSCADVISESCPVPNN